MVFDDFTSTEDVLFKFDFDFDYFYSSFIRESLRCDFNKTKNYFLPTVPLWLIHFPIKFIRFTIFFLLIDILLTFPNDNLIFSFILQVNMDLRYRAITAFLF